MCLIISKYISFNKNVIVVAESIFNNSKVYQTIITTINICMHDVFFFKLYIYCSRSSDNNILGTTVPTY